MLGCFAGCLSPDVLGNADIAFVALIFPPAFIFTPIRWGGGGPPLPKDAVSAAWTELLWGSDQLWSPHFPSTIVGPDFSVPRDYFQIGITSASQIRCIFLKEKKQNSKLYSLVVTTPPQKTANWEGSLCILCRRGKGGEWKTKKRKRQTSTSPASQARLSHSCNAAAAPLRFASRTKTRAFLRWVLAKVWKKSGLSGLYQKCRFKFICSRSCRDVNRVPIYGSISIQRRGDDSTTFLTAWPHQTHCLYFVGN